ncbi:MAG: hypothetical protein ACLQGV_17470 [Bryobacteraceae bacterium]
MDLLLEIEERLDELAQEASQHVGVPYRHTGLGLFAWAQSAEISGGPSGDAGDIWFEIQYTFDEGTQEWHAPPWTVESQIIVFCADPPAAAVDQNCTHVLAGLVAETDTPRSAVEALAAHVGILAAEVRKRKAVVFTESRHATLANMGGGGTG